MSDASTLRLFNKKTFLLCLVFFSINAWYSYAFYHVDCYKLLVLGIGISLLFFKNDLVPLLFKTKQIDPAPLNILIILVLPFLGTLPGLLLHGGMVNFNFSYETAIFLSMFLWIYYILKTIQEKHHIENIIFWIGTTIIFVSIISLFEKFGFNPFDWSALPTTRVKSTFGNPNFFAGFLAPLLPLFFALLMFQTKNKTSLITQTKQPVFIFCLVVILMGGAALWFTQTRSAIAAAILGVFCVFVLHMIYSPQKNTIKHHLALVLIILSILCITIVIISINDLSSRFWDFSGIKQSWAGRLVNWQATLKSISDSSLLGYGLGSYYNLFFEYVAPDSRLLWHERSFMHPHSEILEVMQNGGIFGTLLWLYMWVYIFSTMFKTLKNPNLSMFYKRLLTGIISGLIAFHLQGIISIAPRKVTVLLGVYTIIGIGLSICCLADKERTTAAHSSKNNLLKILPATVVLSVFWYFLIPWATTQYQFVKLINTPPSTKRLSQLEKLRDQNPNIYALDFLAFEQLANLRFDEVKKTLKKIHKAVPHYRRVDILEPALEYLNGNIEQSRQKALNYQKRDFYDLGTIQLLTRVAILTKDMPLFVLELQRVLEYWLITTKTDNIDSATQVKVEINQKIKNNLNISAKDKEMVFKISPSFFDWLFNTTTPSLKGKKLSPNERQDFTDSITATLNKTSYFKPVFKNNLSEKEKKEALDNLAKYVQLENKRKQEIQTINQTQQKKLKAGQDNKRELNKLFNAKTAEINQAYQKKQKALILTIQNKLDLKNYLKRRDIGQRLLRFWISLTYPEHDFIRKGI